MPTPTDNKATPTSTSANVQAKIPTLSELTGKKYDTASKDKSPTILKKNSTQPPQPSSTPVVKTISDQNKTTTLEKNTDAASKDSSSSK